MRLTGTALDQAAIGDELVVLHVQSPTMAPEWARWLEEIGFVAGERVRLMARGFTGSDPLVVRIGQSTFALRQAEAACIQVVPRHTQEPSASNYMAALQGSRA